MTLALSPFACRSGQSLCHSGLKLFEELVQRGLLVVEELLRFRGVVPVHPAGPIQEVHLLDGNFHDLAPSPDILFPGNAPGRPPRR